VAVLFLASVQWAQQQGSGHKMKTTGSSFLFLEMIIVHYHSVDNVSGLLKTW
jgi:hypothetical protein